MEVHHKCTYIAKCIGIKMRPYSGLLQRGAEPHEAADPGVLAPGAADQVLQADEQPEPHHHHSGRGE